MKKLSSVGTIKKQSMGTRLMAIDLGASGGKCFAGLFGRSGFSMREIHRFAYEGVPFFLSEHNGTISERLTWDDNLIYANILAGLHTWRRELGNRLDGIGIDTWGTDGHFIGADGDIPGKVYAYRDRRLDRMIDEVKALIPAERIYGITGIHFQPFNISNQLLWFLRNRHHFFKAGSRYAPMPALFYYYLGGTIKVDSTFASVTQLMDARTKKWSPEILRRLGIPRAVLPEIVPPGSVIGKLHQALAKSLGINQARLVAVGGHDTASAFAAAPAIDPAKALIISSGTWSLVGRFIEQPVTTAEAMALNLSNEGGIGNIRLLKNCMGGWLVHELRRVWRDRDGVAMEWPEIYRLAAAAPAFVSIIDPDDPVLYNPVNMETSLQACCRKLKQKIPASRGAMLRMVYESLALKYRRINEDLGRVCGKPGEVVHIVGGGSRNDMLNQFTADALGLPVLAGPVEATAVGNLMVQALGVQAIKSMAAAIPMIKDAFPIKEYRPRDRVAWDRAYADYNAKSAHMGV